MISACTGISGGKKTVIYALFKKYRVLTFKFFWGGFCSSKKFGAQGKIMHNFTFSTLFQIFKDLKGKNSVLVISRPTNKRKLYYFVSLIFRMKENKFYHFLSCKLRKGDKKCIYLWIIMCCANLKYIFRIF